MPQAFFRHLGIWGCLFISKAVKHCSEALHVCFGTRSWLGTSLTGLLSETSKSGFCCLFCCTDCTPQGRPLWTAVCWHLEGIRVGCWLQHRKQVSTAWSPGGHWSYRLPVPRAWTFCWCPCCMGSPLPWLRDISDSLDCLCCHSKDHTSPWWRSSCLRGCEEDIWRFNGFRRKVCQSSPFLT